MSKTRPYSAEARRFKKRMIELRAINEAGLISGDYSCENIWQMMGRKGEFETRQAWIAEAGWDPAGWVFLNWRQLPREFRLDLAKLGLDKIEKLIVKGREKNA